MRLTNIMIVTLAFMFVGCETDDSKHDISLNDINVFALCEGNFGAGNASLWRFDLEGVEADGPIYEKITGDQLGDVGQSLTLVDDNLFIINNNSNTIEVLNLADEITYTGTIDLPWAGPREMVALDGIGYVTNWYAGGIIAIDLTTLAIIDTLICEGMTENIVVDGNDLYVSVTMNSDWTSANKVLRISTTTKQVTQEFEVVTGPGQLKISGDHIYIASTYYDANWTTYVGLSTINLNTGTVIMKEYGATFSYTSDLVVIDNTVHYITTSGAVPVNADLSTNESQQIATLKGVYSAGAFDEYLYFGVTTDYIAPDTVYVYDMDGTLIGSTPVGAIPGSYATYIQN